MVDGARGVPDLVLSSRVPEVLPSHSRFAAKERTSGSAPSRVAAHAYGDAAVRRPRAFRASGRRPRLFSRCLIASESHARGACAVGLATEIASGSSCATAVAGCSRRA